MKSQKEKHGSRELGLVLAQQLLDVQDLHYGLWDDDLPLRLSNMSAAQQRYSDLLLEQVACLLEGLDSPCLLDVGCGTGHLLEQLLERGFHTDAVNPAPVLNRQVRTRLAQHADMQVTLYESDFQSLPLDDLQQRYDLLLFSESFQYIPLDDIFTRAAQLLRPGGYLLVCDFFKTSAHGDGDDGDHSFSGGHVLASFHDQLKQSPFTLKQDEDITTRISPNIALLDEWLMQRLLPASQSINEYLQARYPWRSRLLKWLTRHKRERLRYKYLSGHRSQAVFEKYKSYRLLVMQRSMSG